MIFFESERKHSSFMRPLASAANDGFVPLLSVNSQAQQKSAFRH
jgi:hypothetical protein